MLSGNRQIIVKSAKLLLHSQNSSLGAGFDGVSDRLPRQVIFFVEETLHGGHVDSAVNVIDHVLDKAPVTSIVLVARFRMVAEVV
jgi:hypothetical protein